MPNDFNLPTNSSDYDDVLGLLRDQIAACAKMLFTGDSNIPTNAIEWDNTNKTFKRDPGGTPVNIGGPIPPGGMVIWPAASAPDGWLICDGSAISRTTYADLFAKISTVWGAGNGTTTFNIPDMRGRFPLGKAASGTGNTLAGTGGALDHTHTVPPHYHGVGTGADIHITASGSHSHSIDHNHASVTSGGSGSLSTDSQGAHTHFVVAEQVSSTTLSASNAVARSFDGGGGVYAYDLKGSGNAIDRGLTSSNGAHTHSIASHTHDVDLPNFTGSSGSATHIHSVGEFSGVIGLVTGGVNGNASMTSGTANPPFAVVNYIIKV